MPPSLPGLEGGQSRQLFKCLACYMIPRGSDFSRHYKNNTNFNMLHTLALMAIIMCAADPAFLSAADPAFQYFPCSANRGCPLLELCGK